jgi:peptidoglycan hydrolase FlgJ
MRMDNSIGHFHDFSVFNNLRREASAPAGDSPETIRQVARQFEAIFVQMMMKSMRETVPEGGLINDDSMRFYQDMVDQQLSLNVAGGKGIGLAPAIERQLSRGLSAEADALRLSITEKDPMNTTKR